MPHMFYTCFDIDVNLLRNKFFRNVKSVGLPDMLKVKKVGIKSFIVSEFI